MKAARLLMMSGLTLLVYPFAPWFWWPLLIVYVISEIAGWLVDQRWKQ